MKKKKPYRKDSPDKSFLFPPSAYSTCATVNVYKSRAKNTEEAPDENRVRKTDAELAEELRNWSVENKL